MNGFARLQVVALVVDHHLLGDVTLQGDGDLWAYLNHKGGVAEIDLELVAAPLWGQYRREAGNAVVGQVEVTEALNDGQPATWHTGDVETLINFIVVVVQIEAAGVDEVFVRFVELPQAGGQDGVDIG